MTQDELKLAVAREAVKYVIEGSVIGVGSGSTANLFIDELAQMRERIKGAVASSVTTAERLVAKFPDRRSGSLRNRDDHLASALQDRGGNIAINPSKAQIDHGIADRDVADRQVV